MIDENPNTNNQKSKRLFIGVGVEGKVRGEIERIVQSLQRKRWSVKWEPPEKWHVTMAFLGKVEVREIQKVQEALQVGRQFTQIRLKIKGLGQFPEQKRMVIGSRVHGRNAVPIKFRPARQLVLPQVVWLGLKGEVQRLDGLAKQVRQGLDEVGVEYDKKVFRLHVTLARVKREASVGERMEMAKMIGKMRELTFQHEWMVKRVVLYASTLTQAGSRYEVICEVKLGDRK